MRARLALALAAAVVALGTLGACGDNDNPGIDAAPGGDAGPTPDASPGNDFTAFVKDQVVNHTSATEDPVPFATFSGLPDDDLDDDLFAAYDSLF